MVYGPTAPSYLSIVMRPCTRALRSLSRLTSLPLTSNTPAPARERDPEEGVGIFRTGESRPPSEVMVAFIDAHREAYGVEPICRVLPIIPSLRTVSPALPSKSTLSEAPPLVVTLEPK
jgi:hypothetical protein